MFTPNPHPPGEHSHINPNPHPPGEHGHARVVVQRDGRPRWQAKDADGHGAPLILGVGLTAVYLLVRDGRPAARQGRRGAAGQALQRRALRTQRGRQVAGQNAGVLPQERRVGAGGAWAGRSTPAARRLQGTATAAPACSRSKPAMPSAPSPWAFSPSQCPLSALSVLRACSHLDHGWLQPELL